MVYLLYVLSILGLLFIWKNEPCNAPPRYKNIKKTIFGHDTLVPRATLRGVAELHVASGMPQCRMFVTCCYF